jgi:hypothetical protein
MGRVLLYDQLYGQEVLMQTVNLVEAKTHLSQLVEKAMQGEPVRIMLTSRCCVP